jgi:hypothetical protein
MAIAIRSAVTPTFVSDANGPTSLTNTITFPNLVAGDLVLLSCSSYVYTADPSFSTPTMTGATFVLIDYQSAYGQFDAAISNWYAIIGSSLTAPTASVTVTPSAPCYYIGNHLSATVLSGTHATTPVGNKSKGGPAGVNITTTGVTTVANNSWLYVDAYNYQEGTGTSSDLTLRADSVYSLTTSGYKNVATSGTSATANLNAPVNNLDGWAYVAYAIKPASGTAYTASATATATATATASMSSSRVGAGSGSETATGTAAASNQRALAGTSSVTASATAAMSLTQVIGASGTGTATGTAAAAVTAVVTVSGSATVTASGTASMSSTQVFAGSATVTATGTADSSIRPIVTVDGAGSITATGTTTFNKSQTLAASATASASATAGLISITPISGASTATATATALALITTPGTLYGNATKVAGLYGSSTKPTLTTRS